MTGSASTRVKFPPGHDAEEEDSPGMNHPESNELIGDAMNLEALSRLVPEPERFLADPPKSPEAWSIPDDSISSIFDLAELDRIIAGGLMDYRHIRMSHNNVVLPKSDFTWGEGAPIAKLRGRIRPQIVNRLIRSGASLVLNELEYYCDAVGDLCRRLVLETGQKATVAGFLTPASSSGLTPHRDVESVLLIQTYGSKRWRLTASSRPQPLEHERDLGKLSAEDVERIELGEPDFEVTLKVGEALWIPRGWLHANTTTEEPSLHVTIGFAPYTRYWLANAVLRGLGERLSDHDVFRADLPWGIAGESKRIEVEVAEVVDQLSVALRQLNQEEVVTRIRQSMSGRYLAPRRSHPVSTAIGAEAMLDTRVELVVEAVSRTERLPDGRLRLNLRDTAVTVPAAAGDWLETRLSCDDAAVWSPRDMVPALDETSATKVVTALVHQGVVRTV